MPEKDFLKYKICVAGAAETGHCGDLASDKAMVIGQEIVKNNGIVITGATGGVTLWSAKGAKEAGGFVMGISPASSKKEHIEKYGLPVEYFDFIVYTGLDYSGRNLLLSRSSDAIVLVCGRMGTLNLFTTAFEDEKPIGVLIKTGGTADEIKNIVEKSHRGGGNVIYDSDPQTLIKNLIKLIKKVEENNHNKSR